MSSTLYLRIAENVLHFARYEVGPQPSFAFSTYKLRPQTSLTVNLREACETEDLLKAPVSRVQALVVGPVTPVPLADFQEEDCEALYDFCFPKDKPRKVFYDVVPAAGAVLLFALDETTCRALEESFGNVHYISAQTAVLRHFSVKTSPTQPRRLFVYCHEQAADIAVFDENRLLMANSYPVHAPVDTAYYVFNIARHQGTDAASLPVYVIGAPELRDGVVAELRKYARQVFPVSPGGEFNRHVVATTEGVPYDLTALLLER